MADRAPEHTTPQGPVSHYLLCHAHPPQVHATGGLGGADNSGRCPARPHSRRAWAFVITMPWVIQRGTETFKITSVVRIAGPSTLRRNVPEGRWSPRCRLSVETIDVPPIAPAAQRSTWSLDVAAVCASGI